MDESNLERKKREKAEYEAELKEERALENFKMKHKKVQKRTRDPPSLQGELERWLEPAAKRCRRYEVLEEQLLDIKGIDFCLGEWLDRNERLCQRVGNLREVMRLGNLRVLRLMDCYKMDRILDDLSTWWKGQETADQHPASLLVESHVNNITPTDEMHARNAPAMAGDDPSISSHPTGGKPVPRNSNKLDMNLTGFIGWIRRIEKLEISFWKEVVEDQKNCDIRLEGNAKKTSFLNNWKTKMEKKCSSQLEEAFEVPNTAPNRIRTPKRKAAIETNISIFKKSRILKSFNSGIIGSPLPTGTLEIERESLVD